MIVVLFRSPSTPTTTKQLLHQHSLCLHEQIAAAAVAASEREGGFRRKRPDHE